MSEYHTFIVELILSIGSVITSIASCIAAWHGIRNGRALADNKEAMAALRYSVVKLPREVGEWNNNALDR